MGQGLAAWPALPRLAWLRGWAAPPRSFICKIVFHSFLNRNGFNERAGAAERERYGPAAHFMHAERGHRSTTVKNPGNRPGWCRSDHQNGSLVF
jgi:hypothetical protein